MVVVVVGELDGPETHEEWILSCGGSLQAGGVNEFGSCCWIWDWDWGNQDGGSITEWVLWFLVCSPALMLGTERLQHSSETELSQDTGRLSVPGPQLYNES